MALVDEERETRAEPTGTSDNRYPAMVLGAVLVVIGGLWLLDVVDVIDLRAAVVLPAALAVVGLALIIGAWDGPHTGLVVVGVLLTGAVLAAAVTPPNAFRGGIGERSFVVTEQADLDARYDVGVGELFLDMGDLTLTESADVDVTVGAGDMRVVVPDDVAVSVGASVGAGQIDLFGTEREGLSVSESYVSDGFDDAEVRLVLDLDVAAGSIEVTR